MYKMPYFTEADNEKVLEFMKAHAFVTLIGYDEEKNVATQIPVLFEDTTDGTITIRGHIMRKTDHHLAFEKNPDALVLFMGPHCYVSSSWYTEKTGATWNYQTVHARGKIEFLDESSTVQILQELTEKYEKEQSSPLLIENLPDGYVSHMVKAIVGIKIKIEELYPIFKLSQNRDDESYVNIVAQLEKTDDADAHKIAKQLRIRRPQLF